MHVFLLVISILCYESMNIATAAGDDYNVLETLHNGAWAGDGQLVQTLIDQEMRIRRLPLNWQSYGLQYALLNHKYDVADLLIAAGGDVNCSPEGFDECDENKASPFQRSIIDGDLAVMLYCIDKDKRCGNYINTKLPHEAVKNLKIHLLIGCIYRTGDKNDSQREEMLKILLACHPKLDDLAVETKNPRRILFGKTVEQGIRQLGTPAMVKILDKYIAGLIKQGDHGMQEELGGQMLNERALEGILGHFAELGVLANYAKSKQ